MPTQNNEGSENRDALVKLYTELWGFNQKDANEEADKVIQRGPSSPIYQSRMAMAQQHLNQRPEPPVQRPTDPEEADYPAAPYDPAMNPYGRRPGTNLPGAYPEDVMLDPRHNDPAAWAAQDLLNKRRAALAAIPVSPAPIAAAAQTPQHLEDANLSSWQALANFLGYRR